MLKRSLGISASPARLSWCARMVCVLGVTLAACLRAQTLLVKPYVQPGDGAVLGATDVKVIAWLADQTPGAFTVEFGRSGAMMRSVVPESTTIHIAGEPRYVAYVTRLADLPLNSEIHYRVKLAGQTVGDSTFLTRKTPDQALRFVVVGDLASGQPSQRPIAFQIAEAKPEFAVLCGDIVYSNGLVSEYAAKFWPVYCNADRTDPVEGTHVMRSVPFYGVLGNHDTEDSDLGKLPDAFAAFYFFHPPRNGPGIGPWTPPIPGPAERVNQFKAAASAAGYPYLGFYSFDNGPAHFLVIDSDDYLPLKNDELREWIQHDLTATKARWKMVFCHHPGFNSTAKHGGDQRLRLFAPLFEECGVDVAFAGHVHNYQRSKPLRFTPNDPRPAKTTGPVRGTFTIDEEFDGKEHTAARGVIYVVTGGGGAELYTMLPNGLPGAIVPDPDAPTTFTAKFVDDRHSFSLVELNAAEFVLHQIDEKGTEVDRVTVTKHLK